MQNKKLVSYCLFTYNQEKYIEAAIDGALNQTYSPLEIIISDDCSADSTFQMIQDTIKSYDGPHKIVVNRNETNLGIGGHVSKICYDIANGDYIVLVGGDDISFANHVERAVESIEKYPDVNLVDFTAEIINAEDEVVRQIELEYDYKRFTIDNYIKLKGIQSFAPGRIIRKELILKFNPISNNCPTEDSVFVLRGLLTSGIIRANISLVKYRQHESNISSAKGMKKISHSSIISQYLVDIIHLNSLGAISQKQFQFLVKRIYFELRHRNLIYSNGSLTNKTLTFLWVRILKYRYLLSLLFRKSP